ncbi:hypothetical protein C8R46DRAFT_1355500 [Mycena filopes]|nr:hypothetical protein C8R46DRAFT_1355500 [Mycena filopes]
MSISSPLSTGYKLSRRYGQPHTISLGPATAVSILAEDSYCNDTKRPQRNTTSQTRSIYVPRSILRHECCANLFQFPTRWCRNIRRGQVFSEEQRPGRRTCPKRVVQLDMGSKLEELVTTMRIRKGLNPVIPALDMYYDTYYDNVYISCNTHPFSLSVIASETRMLYLWILAFLSAERERRK